MSSHQEQDLNIDGIAEKDVVEFLQKHPRFFENNLDILSELRLPHPSGTAISLIERQVDVLRDNNHSLEQKLNNLIQIARDNDRLNGRIQKMALALLEANELDEIFYAVQVILRSEFNADTTTLRCFGTPKTTTTLDENAFLERDDELEKQFSKFFDKNKPICGPLDSAQAQFLFGDNADSIISAALVPVTGQQGMIGMLAIGSFDINRFHPAMGTIFLTYIGEMIGRVLEPYLK